MPVYPTLIRHHERSRGGEVRIIEPRRGRLYRSRGCDERGAAARRLPVLLLAGVLRVVVGLSGFLRILRFLCILRTGVDAGIGKRGNIHKGRGTDAGGGGDE